MLRDIIMSLIIFHIVEGAAAENYSRTTNVYVGLFVAGIIFALLRYNS